MCCGGWRGGGVVLVKDRHQPDRRYNNIRITFPECACVVMYSRKCMEGGFPAYFYARCGGWDWGRGVRSEDGGRDLSLSLVNGLVSTKIPYLRRVQLSECSPNVCLQNASARPGASDTV